VTQKEGTSNLLFPNFEALSAVQKELLDTLTRANRAWFACCNEEAAMASNFARKMTTARSIPEAAAAYQEWASQQMELFSRQAQKVFEDTQDLTKAYARIMGNGKGHASS